MAEIASEPRDLQPQDDQQPQPQQDEETTREVDEGRTDGNEGGEHRTRGNKPENIDSIPTAGGERLGEKHWGESDVVPENPKSQNQLDDQTAANTNKNKGSAGEDGDGEQKESFIDKIKDKLHK